MNIPAQNAATATNTRNIRDATSYWHWDTDSASLLALTLLFALEALMFYTQLAGQILPYFPRAFDQAGYSVASYALIDKFHAHGWAAFFRQIVNPGATGMSFILQGALLSLVGGANRGAFASLNLMYFMILQLCLFFSLRLRTGSLTTAWLAMAFTLSLKTHFNAAGGLYDYRIDYSALCLYGIFCSLLVASRRFSDRNIVVAIVVVSVSLVLERFFSILYVGFVLLGLFVYAMIRWKASKDSARDQIVVRRIFICGSAILICVLPVLMLARNAIYSYYIVGHFLGSEKYIRAAESGVRSLRDNLTYYPWSVETAHFGKGSLHFIVAVVILLMAICVLGGRGALRSGWARLQSFGFEFLSLVFAIAVPLILLTLDCSKSPVVGGIVTIPCVLLATLFISSFLPEWHITTFLPERHRTTIVVSPIFAAAAKRSRTLPTLFCVTVGLGMFLANGTGPQHWLGRADLERINGINDAVSDYIIANVMPRPSISFDRVIEYLNVATVQIAGWERWGRFIDVVPKFGYGEYGIFATPRDVAMKLLLQSDIVVLSDSKLGRESSSYPIDSKIPEYWDDMWRWTNANLLPLYETNIGGIPYRVFRKATFTLEGESVGWVTSRGLTLLANRSDLERWPVFVLEGNADLGPLGGVPQPRAILAGDSASAIDLPAFIGVTAGHYRITIDGRAAAGPSGQARVRLTFDRYFVPKQLGINEDTRELVVRTPSLHELQAKARDK